MKKNLFFCLMALLAVSCNNASNTEELSSKKAIQTATMDVQRFKMMETSNIHILLKWDTRTGKTWMVQYGLDDTPAMEKIIPHSYILQEEKSWNGRFELYPTQNMFNFIMIDTHTGDTYQLQWSFEESYCGVIPITTNSGK